MEKFEEEMKHEAHPSFFVNACRIEERKPIFLPYRVISSMFAYTVRSLTSSRNGAPC